MVLAGLLLVGLAPLGALIALAIRVDSRGPVLFRQRRVGLGGTTFEMLKFRSMQSGASDEPHRIYVRQLIRGSTGARGADGAFKLSDDARITRVGRFLRRTSLDELPQLWNVLRGEMSLVGPRPPLDYEVELYTARQRVRLSVRPGLTGLWQVSGRNSLSYSDMCELDAQYVENWAHGMDLRILLLTIPVVLMNSGRAN